MDIKTYILTILCFSLLLAAKDPVVSLRTLAGDPEEITRSELQERFTPVEGDPCLFNDLSTNKLAQLVKDQKRLDCESLKTLPEGAEINCLYERQLELKVIKAGFLDKISYNLTVPMSNFLFYQGTSAVGRCCILKTPEFTLTGALYTMEDTPVHDFTHTAFAPDRKLEFVFREGCKITDLRDTPPLPGSRENAPESLWNGLILEYKKFFFIVAGNNVFTPFNQCFECSDPRKTCSFCFVKTSDGIELCLVFEDNAYPITRPVRIKPGAALGFTGIAAEWYLQEQAATMPR